MALAESEEAFLGLDVSEYQGYCHGPHVVVLCERILPNSLLKQFSEAVENDSSSFFSSRVALQLHCVERTRAVRLPHRGKNLYHRRRQYDG